MYIMYRDGLESVPKVVRIFSLALPDCFFANQIHFFYPICVFQADIVPTLHWSPRTVASPRGTTTLCWGIPHPGICTLCCVIPHWHTMLVHATYCQPFLPWPTAAARPANSLGRTRRARLCSTTSSRSRACGTGLTTRIPLWWDEILVQWSVVTVTPSGTDKTVTVTDCQCHYLQTFCFIEDQLGQAKTVNVANCKSNRCRSNSRPLYKIINYRQRSRIQSVSGNTCLFAA